MFKKNDSGLFLYKEGEAPKMITGPFEVTAHTYSPNGLEGFGIQLQWTARNNQVHNRTFKMADIFMDEGKSLVQQLVDTGFFCSTNLAHRRYFIDYISKSNALKTIISTDTTGWVDDQFVTPSWVKGNPNGTEVVYSGSVLEPLESKGAHNDWCESVAKFAQGNDLIILVMCACLAAPYLQWLGWDSFIIHFYGTSKSGKTTLLKISISIFSLPNSYDTWSSTSNGLEARSISRNSLPLALDELHQAQAEDITNSIYQIGNGISKMRSTRNASLRERKRWSVIGISTGEISLEQKLAEANKNVQAGMLMRFLQIPVVQKYGAFEDLHHFKSPKEFADHLNEAIQQNYGTALPEMIGKVYDKDKYLDFIKASIRKTVQSWCNEDGENHSSQAKFAAERFAFMACIGELAIEKGVLPWPKETALNAFRNAYALWIANRNDTAGLEEKNLINALKRALPTWRRKMKPPKAETQDGWFEITNNTQAWHITKECFMTGLQLEHSSQLMQITHLMAQKKWLESNERTRGTFRSTISGRSQRNFKIFPEKIYSDLNELSNE